MKPTRVPRRGPLVPALLLLALVCAGCAASTVRPVTGPTGKPPVVFAFLENGTTPRAQVIQKLGKPAATFESERILAYRLDKKAKPTFSLELATHSLILVFDERGVLERHALVRVR